MVHIPSFLIGSSVTGISFLLLHQQFSYRERLTYIWTLQEMVEKRMQESWDQFHHTKTGHVAEKNLMQIANIPTALTKTWNKGIAYIQDALKTQDDANNSNDR